MQDERKNILIKNQNINEACTEPSKNEKQLMLFLSFDITDSTKQKVKHPEKWSRIIDILVKSKFQFMDYWKFNGDEILYKRNVNSIDFVCRVIQRANEHLKKLNTEMGKIIDNISVKATIWMALSETDAMHYMHNFSFKFEDEIDFVGKNIDEGFRLTKCSSMRKIAIDPKIVYILLDTCMFFRQPTNRDMSINYYKSKDNCDMSVFGPFLAGIVSKIHLVGYARCKGIWNDNPYPVYWYYEDVQDSEIRYDEYLNGEHLWQKNICALSASDPSTDYGNLYSIFEQMGVLNEIQEIHKLLCIQGDLELSATGKANLYYMVVCTNPKSKKVMIAKRSLQRKHLKNVWDFGNVKYQNVNMKDTIKKEYKNTFGIDIDLVLDENRGNNLKPFGYCTIYRNCKPHNSILCHALISNPCDVDDEDLIEYIMEHKSPAYDEIRFVDAEDVSSFESLSFDDIRLDSENAELDVNEPFKENTCIMYFKDSIRGAMDV